MTYTPFPLFNNILTHPDISTLNVRQFNEHKHEVYIYYSRNKSKCRGIEPR